MAKMIKCPTCGTQIEVPAQLTGQVIKCPGCGKGLKLVAKKKEPTPGGGIQLSASGTPINSGGSMAGGSMSGQTVSAMSFHGEPPPPDDMPNLDTVCQVCGRPTEFDQLAEDNGKLVCRDCIKGARSGMARRAGGAEMVEFKAPEYRPYRRAKMINFTPALLLAICMAIIWCICQVYLSTHPEPKGTAMASMTKPRPGSHDSHTPAAPEPTTAPVTSADTQPSPGGVTNVVGPPATAPAVAETATTGPAAPAPTTTSSAVAIVPPAPPGSIFSPDDGKPGAGANPSAPTTPTPVIPAPPPTVTATDPLDRGMEHLLARSYEDAFRDFTDARRKYPMHLPKPGEAPPSAQSLTTTEGQLAASLGMYLQHPANTDQLRNVRSFLDSAYKSNIRTRSLALNGAIAALASPTAPNVLLTLADLLKSQMESHAGDEYAADVFGSLVNRLASTPSLPAGSKEKIDGYWTFLDGYEDAMATSKNDGKLKWGVDWLPADEVKGYRPLRNTSRDNARVTDAAKTLEAAGQHVHTAEAALTLQQQRKAAGQPADVQGAQKQLDDANAAFTRAQKALDEANAMLKYRKPRWLETFEPVVPEAASAQ
jgi:hypothetical protein